ncbi:unnamed protein product [Acanthoscelides obtectus]|uniref:Uncharacterized protein n=1 Tax=Acanthoscelides obtectus TaxID=200917 RepID=A0A9P0M3S9_ACAOB|nr:unnamed protein product [Acanthoscelides obtectus]CAK1679745.1 hypothetical protein AOBTE_LOCUS32427 [Acanthoscelides obtectus]
MINLALDVHQLSESTKMLKKFECLCLQTIDSQSINYPAAKFVPRALTDNQEEHQVETCRALKQQLESDPNYL